MADEVSQLIASDEPTFELVSAKTDAGKEAAEEEIEKSAAVEASTQPQEKAAENARLALRALNEEEKRVRDAADAQARRKKIEEAEVARKEAAAAAAEATPSGRSLPVST